MEQSNSAQSATTPTPNNREPRGTQKADLRASCSERQLGAQGGRRDFLLRALAASKLLQQSNILHCRAAGKPAIHGARSENGRFKDQVAGQSVNSLRLDQRPLNRQYVLGRTEPKPSLAFLKCRKTTPTQLGKHQDATVKQQCFEKRLEEDL